MNDASTELIKRLTKRLVTKSWLTKAQGTTGNMGTRIRGNKAFEILLRHRIKKDGLTLSTMNINDIRKRTLDYVESMRTKTRPYGQYSYCDSNAKPILYASIYACLTRHLYRDIENLSEGKKREWTDYIQHSQTEDGLFKDPLIENELAEKVDWWGWRHLTLHAIMALTALGSVARRHFLFLEKFKDRRFVVDWLTSRNWKDNPANVSNEIQNYGTLLQYSSDFQEEKWASDALNILFDSLDKIQDARTGLWGNNFDTPTLLSNGVQTGYHIWLLYFYGRRKINFQERIIESCLATQNRLGGFGPFLNSSACEDIDSLDPLARLYFSTSHHKAAIKSSIERALPWVFTNMNRDGGFVFRRYEPFLAGHENMFSGVNQSCMFSTWFRTLSLAYMGKVLQESTLGKFDWQFLHCPGHQFWLCESKT